MSRSRTRTASPAAVDAPAPDALDTDSPAAVDSPEPAPADTDSPSTDSTDSTDSPSTDSPSTDDAPSGDDAQPEPAPADPSDTFRGLFRAALADVQQRATDAHSGGDAPDASVPLSTVDAVTSAYRTVPVRQRGDVLAGLGADAVRDALAGVPAVMPAVLGASSALTDACRAVGTAPAVAPEPLGVRPAALALGLLSLGAHAVTIEADGGARWALLLDVDASGLLGVVLGAPADDADTGAALGWTFPEPASTDDTDAPADVQPEPAAVVRARRAVAAVTPGQRAPRTSSASTGGTSTGARGNKIALHVRAAIDANGGAPLTDAGVRNTDTDTYPAGARPSSGAIGTMSAAAAAAVGVQRVTVDGRNGWGLAPASTDAPAPASTDSTDAPDA